MTRRQMVALAVLVGGEAFAQAVPEVQTSIQPTPVEWRFSSVPYFQEGPEGQAKKAFDLGRVEAAQQLLSGIHLSPAGRYLEAQCAYRLREFDKAAGLFRALSDAFVPLKAHSLWMAGKAYASVGKWEEAIQTWSQVNESSALYTEARLHMADALAARGAYASAIETLIDARRSQRLSRFQREGTLQKIAHFAEKGRWLEMRSKALVELWAISPHSPEAIKAERGWGKKGVPLEARARRAEYWVDTYRYEQARSEAARILKAESLPGENACRASLVIGRSLRMERRHAEAARVLHMLPQQCLSEKVRAEALFLLASAQSLSGHRDAVTSYVKFVEEFPTHRNADDALYYAADLALKAEDTSSAHRYLDRILSHYPQEDYAPAAGFRQFWTYYGEKNWEQALTALQSYRRVISVPDLAHFQAQAKYWEARVLAHSGQRDASQSAFLDVLVQHPGTLYATWAQRQLASKRIESTEPVFDWEKGVEELQQDVLFQTATELARMKVPEARKAFAAVSLKGKSVEARGVFVQTLREFGFDNLLAAFSEKTLLPILSGPLTASTSPVFAAHRPAHMLGLLSNEAARSGVELELVQGIVHRESGYNPEAMSPVGAVGLMQLMPDTATILSRRLSTKAPSLGDLKKATVNARLGTFYLGDLIRRFDGHVELAVAAYNAGPGRVQKWRASRPDLEIDEFVESIPIKETRHYVKDVLGDRAAYRILKWRSAISAARTTPHGG